MPQCRAILHHVTTRYDFTTQAIKSPSSTVTMNEQLGVLVNRLFVQINKEIIKDPHYWPFVRGIHRWPVDSSHKGPVMRQVPQSHDVIMHVSSPQPPRFGLRCSRHGRVRSSSGHAPQYRDPGPWIMWPHRWGGDARGPFTTPTRCQTR